jgi:hypothetical protein
VSKSTVLAVGFRGGISHSFGLEQGDVGNDYLAVPLWLDVGVRLGNLFLGAYGRYGIMQTPAPPCPLASTCTQSAHDIRFGAEVLYHFGPSATVDPWVGVGLGYQGLYESASIARNDGLSIATDNVTGFFDAVAQAGIDLHVAPSLSVGPFVAVAVDASATTAAWPIAGLNVELAIPLSHAARAETVSSAAGPRDGQCQKDVDCKGDRICRGGACTAP